MCNCIQKKKKERAYNSQIVGSYHSQIAWCQTLYFFNLSRYEIIQYCLQLNEIFHIFSNCIKDTHWGQQDYNEEEEN